MQMMTNRGPYSQSTITVDQWNPYRLLELWQKIVRLRFFETLLEDNSQRTGDPAKNRGGRIRPKGCDEGELNMDTRLVLVFVAALTIGGCALSLAPPKDVPGSLLRDKTIYAPQKPAKAQPVLATIRFPARVEQRAELLLEKAYREQYLNIS